MSSNVNLLFNMNPLDAYFINQSQNPGKLTFVNALFWEKKGSYTQATSSFQFRRVNISTAHDVSWVSSLILRAKPWLTQKVLHHGNRSAARVSRRYFRGWGGGRGGEATTRNASAVRRLNYGLGKVLNSHNVQIVTFQNFTKFQFPPPLHSNLK